MTAKLLIYQTFDEKETFVLGERFTIGRGDACSYTIENPYISRIQATIEQDVAGKYLVYDGAPGRPSRNGLWVNSHRIEGLRVLADGDRITFSDSLVSLEFVLDNETATLTSHGPT